MADDIGIAASTWEPVICDECGQPFDGIGPEPYETCPSCWAEGVMGDG